MEPELFTSNDSTYLKLQNPLKAPLSISVRSTETGKELTNLVLNALSDTLAEINSDDIGDVDAKNLDYSISFGNPYEVRIDTTYEYSFPFPKGKSYKMIQGYGGSFSHTSGFSKYAIDFEMPVGDTVSAARDGIVIGIIDGNDIGGNSRKYRPYANYITLYHSDGTLTQYVHLIKNGALVNIGDTVKALQPIGISGNTGFTSTPHLHFNTLKPAEGGAEGFPVSFKGIDGKDLQKNSFYGN